MYEKKPKGYDDLLEIFYKSVLDLKEKIVDAVTVNEDTEGISKSVTDEIIKAFTPVVDNLKVKYHEIVLPAITQNMEKVIININKRNSEIEKTEE